jgi:transposase
LCAGCNNARRRAPLSPIDNTAPVAAPSPSPPLFDRDPATHTPLTQQQREAIITLHRDGQEAHTIAPKIPCGIRTVNHWIKEHDEDGTLKHKSRSGRPRKTDENTDINLSLTAKVEKFVTPKLLKHKLDLDVSARTVRRRLDEAEDFGRVARMEYPFTAAHLKKRLSFARGYLNWTKKKWATVIFSDETHIELGTTGRVWVQRPAGHAFDYEYVSRTKISHPKRVSAWGCFSRNGVGDICIFTEMLDAKLMRNILNDHLIQSARRLFPRTHWWFLQDNDPKHTSIPVRTWLHNKGVQCLDFPPYSPDLNPIENLWNDLKRRVESHNPSTLAELEQHLNAEWKATDTELLAKLVDSMRRRCKAVIESDGHLTKY